jgi:hypothetical protein
MTFPLKHYIIEDKKEVWIVCNSSITAKGIPALMKQYKKGCHTLILNPYLCGSTWPELVSLVSPYYVLVSWLLE